MRAVLHRHDLRRSLEFEIDWNLALELSFTDAYAEEEHTASSLRFSASIRSTGDPPQPYVQRMGYALDPACEEPLQIGLKRTKSDEFQLTSSHYRPVWRQGRKWPLSPPNPCFGFPDAAVAYFQNTSFVADLGLEMTKLLQSVHYLGPLREHPHRLYQWSGETPEHVGETGERAVEAILAAEHRWFNFKPRQRYKSMPEVVADRLKKMGLIHDFTVTPVAKGRKEYEVRVRAGTKSAQVLLTDVGFGVSQVLPVIVECFYVTARSIVIFEQPEIHLHPAVQAELADLFIDAIRARERGRERGVQFIIESHSEHFLRRLQRRVAEGGLAPEDAALYFVDTEGAHARLRELRIDEYGRITNWPDNFFGDAIGESAAQMKAMIQRRREEQTGGDRG